MHVFFDIIMQNESQAESLFFRYRCFFFIILEIIVSSYKPILMGDRSNHFALCIYIRVANGFIFP